MGQKKSKKLLIIIIILLIILVLLTGFSLLYFFTDTLKGNKELFYKYALQMGEKEDGFIETSVINFFEKQKNTPYTDNGKISVNITAQGMQEQFNNTNKTNITFSGQVDSANSQFEQNISLNYPDNVTFPLIYRQIGQIAGIQTEYVGSKFISTDLSSEDGLFSGNLQTENFSQIQNFASSFTQEDWDHIRNTYLSVINKQLKNTSFSKIEEANDIGYRLLLDETTIKNTEIAILETLRTDQVTLNKLNEITNITTSDIDEILENIENGTETENESIEITVYQNNGKTNKISIKTGEFQIDIEKNIQGDELQYKIEVPNVVTFTATYTGIQALQNVTENYEIKIESEEITYQYNYSNEIEFTENSDIEEFTDENNLFLDDLDEEQKNVLMEAITQRIQDVNKKQMEELGLEESQNPLLYAIPSMSISSANDVINNNTMSETEIAAFNSKFEVYESTNSRGTTVKGLISTIELNNGLSEDEEEDEEQNTSSFFEDTNSSDNLITQIHFDGSEYDEITKQNLLLIKSSIDTEAYYRIEFEKDEETGRIYRVVINKK